MVPRCVEMTVFCQALNPVLSAPNIPHLFACTSPVEKEKDLDRCEEMGRMENARRDEVRSLEIRNG